MKDLLPSEDDTSEVIEHMFPPLELTVVPKFWTYHGRFVNLVHQMYCHCFFEEILKVIRSRRMCNSSGPRVKQTSLLSTGWFQERIRALISQSN